MPASCMHACTRACIVDPGGKERIRTSLHTAFGSGQLSCCFLTVTTRESFLASVLKNQDKIEEMIRIVNDGLKKNLIGKKWELQKKLVSPLIPRDKKEIDDYREKIKKGLEEIINSDIKLNYDNDEVISPPLFELTYSDKDNLEINKKMVKALKKIYQPLNHKVSINQKLNA